MSEGEMQKRERIRGGLVFGCSGRVGRQLGKQRKDRGKEEKEEKKEEKKREKKREKKNNTDREVIVEEYLCQPCRACM